jgi:hypothetical protein
MAKKKVRSRRTAIVPRVVFAVAASACVVPSLAGCGSAQPQQAQEAPPFPPPPPTTTRYVVVTDSVDPADAGTPLPGPGVAAYPDDHRWELMGVAARPDDYPVVGVAVQSQ